MTTVLRPIRADLHVHTALSPCGAEEMTPPAIVQAALEAGLEMIAVCDHNSARNVAAVQEAAEAAGGELAVLAGIEVTSAEEVHVVGLFPDAAAAEAAAAEVRESLPPADAGYYSFFGEQSVLSAEGSPVDNETVALIKRHGGIAIAAHIDRKAFGVLSHLGWFPEDAGFDGVEVSRHVPNDDERMELYRSYGLPVTAASDSHYPNELGAATTILTLAEPTFDEVVLAFRGVDGRGVERA